MKPLLLKAENFCALEDVTLNLADRGLLLVLGDNRDASQADSNGSGKSLLLEAFCWVLWGQTVRGIKGDKVVSLSTKKNCVVSLTFEDEGKSYKVVRHQADKNHIKTNDLEFFADGHNITSNSISETQALIDSVVGMDFITFQAMQPGAGVRAAELTDKSIKELLEKILQTEVLSRAHKLATDKVKELTLKATLEDREISSKEVQLTKSESQLSQYIELHKNFGSSRDFEVKALEEQSKIRFVELNEFEETLRDSVAKEARSEEINKEQEELRAKAVPLLEKYRKDEREVELVLMDIESKLIIQRSNLKTKVAQIDKFRTLGSTCKLCEQSIPHSYADETSDILNSELEAIKEAIQTLEASRNQVGVIALEVATKYKKDAGAIQAKVNLLDAERPVKFPSSDSLNIKIRNTRDALQDYSKRIEDLKNKKSPFDALIKDLEKSIKADKEELKQLKLTETRGDIENYSFWVEGFSPKGIRSQMLKAIAPILNDRAIKYCDILTNGEVVITFETQTVLKNGNTKEDFNISVTQKNGSSSYDGLSAGEKARADLVIAMVLGDLAKFRTNKKMPMRFIDEAFERVDEAGLDAILRLLRDQESQYETIFVVTHKSELKEFFDNSITVIKHNGKSHLKEVDHG